MAIQITIKLTIGQLFNIWVPDYSGIQIPTVFLKMYFVSLFFSNGLFLNVKQIQTSLVPSVCPTFVPFVSCTYVPRALTPIPQRASNTRVFGKNSCKCPHRKIIYSWFSIRYCIGLSLFFRSREADFCEYPKEFSLLTL